jgi:hypothetical protein
VARGYRDEDDDPLANYDPVDFPAGPSRRKSSGDSGYDLDGVEVIAETDNALKIRGPGLSSDPFGVQDPNEEGWIPKSQIHGRSALQADCGVGAKGTITITKWLAEKRGLV